MIGSMKEEASLRSLGPARIFRSLHVQEPSDPYGCTTTDRSRPSQSCWTGISLPGVRFVPFVLVEGEGASKVETRLTVDWDEKKIRMDLSGDLALLPLKKRQHRFLLHTFETAT